MIGEISKTRIQEFVSHREGDIEIIRIICGKARGIRREGLLMFVGEQVRRLLNLNLRLGPAMSSKRKEGRESVLYEFARRKDELELGVQDVGEARFTL